MPATLVGRDVPAQVGMQVRLVPEVDEFIPWVPGGMVGRVLRVEGRKGEAVIVVWPFIRRERLCRTGQNECYELEFVDWGAAKVPAVIHPQFEATDEQDRFPGGAGGCEPVSRNKKRSVSSLGDYGMHEPAEEVQWGSSASVERKSPVRKGSWPVRLPSLTAEALSLDAGSA